MAVDGEMFCGILRGFGSTVDLLLTCPLQMFMQQYDHDMLIFLFFLGVLGIEPRVLGMLGQCSTSEPCPQLLEMLVSEKVNLLILLLQLSSPCFSDKSSCRWSKLT